MSQAIDSKEAQELIKKLSEQFDELLVAGRVYNSDITRDTYGSSGGSFTFIEDGVVHNSYNSFGKYTEQEVEQHLESLDDFRRKYSLTDLLQFFPVQSKVKFTLEKGKLIQVKQFDAQMLLEEIRDDWDNRSQRDSEEYGKRVKTEALFEFRDEAGDLGVFMDYTEHNEKRIISYDFMPGRDAIESLRTYLGSDMEKLYIKSEDGQISAQSIPAYPDEGVQELSVKEIELEESYAKRKAAFEEGVKSRHDFFKSLGKLDDRILFLRVGGFRDYSWPEDSTTHNSCKMRVIHTEDSTILITDGLTDVYKRERDADLQNGIGAEFYMEFHGNIPYEVIHKHYAMALVNATSQIAIGHGNFKGIVERFGTVTVQFSEENVETWINMENDSNHKFESFLTKTRFKKRNGDFGVLTGIESKRVPSKVQLNIDEVMMISIKPIEQKWLTKSKLNSDDNKVTIKAREAIAKEFRDSGENNLVPLTYQKQYVEGEPDSSGTRMVPIFPF